MQVIVDRVEKEYLVVELEDGSISNISREIIDANEGDIIDITVNHEATKMRKNKIIELMDSVFEDWKLPSLVIFIIW